MYAQFPPRTDDHFWRKKVVITLDLREKINVPLESGQADKKLYTNYSTDPITDKSPYSNREGFIVALIKGFKEGKFVGYDPNNLSRQVSFEELFLTLSITEPWRASLRIVFLIRISQTFTMTFSTCV